jgi:hypothetical protein
MQNEQQVLSTAPGVLLQQLLAVVSWQSSSREVWWRQVVAENLFEKLQCTCLDNRNEARQTFREIYLLSQAAYFTFYMNLLIFSVPGGRGGCRCAQLPKAAAARVTWSPCHQSCLAICQMRM